MPLVQTSRYFYPRPPRGGRPDKHGCNGSSQNISIHALREEGDLVICSSCRASLFLSTPSARRATALSLVCTEQTYISIHALREEGDLTLILPISFFWIFLSTPSARRATTCSRLRRSSTKFLSTPSARRATKRPLLYAFMEVISIHALREEGDGLPKNQPALLSNFYPRPPRGGRPII